VAPPLVLHVLPVDLARGAQTYARELRDALDGADVRHRTVTLFHSDAAALRADWSLAVPDGRLRRLGLDPRVRHRLRELLRVERPAVVVAHGGEPLKYVAAAGVEPARLAYYKIGIGGERLRGVSGHVHRRVLARAGVAATVSDDAAAELVALGLARDHVTVIPNGRDPSVYRPRSDGVPGNPTATVRLAFVGHLSTSKRPERFVELVRRLRADGRAVEAVIAGDGPLLAELRAQASEGVEVLGRVDDVPAVLATADAFVFTSVPEGEGMPGVLIEASLAGLPVVTTDVPGARAVVVDGETGFVVPVDDFDALVRATAALVDDPAGRARLGAAGRARASDRFGLATSVAAWRDLLAAMMAGQCASST